LKRRKRAASIKGLLLEQLDGVASALEKDEDFDTLVLRDMQVEVED